MKKVFFITVLTVISLTIFSFRGVTINNDQAEVIDVNEFNVAAKNFVESAQTFPDKFTKWRRSWVEYDIAQPSQHALDRILGTLENF